LHGREDTIVHNMLNVTNGQASHNPRPNKETFCFDYLENKVRVLTIMYQIRETVWNSRLPLVAIFTTRIS